MTNDPSMNIDLNGAQDEVQFHLDLLERQLSSLTEQVQRLQRLASLGTVSAGLAHEINNMLTPIVTHSQYALQRAEPDLMKSALERSLNGGRRLATLCEKILGMAADDRTGPTVGPIAPIVQEAVDCLVRDLSKDDITLTIDVDPELTARFSAVAFQQVVFNLLLNARQAMQGRPGRLTISARSTDSGRVEIEVRDTGCGIRPEHLEKVFEPFFSTKQYESRSDRGGIGLGLHISRQLMTEQDGTIDVVSKPGEGTTFTLTLPAGN